MTPTHDAGPALRVCVLGPLALHVDGTEVAVPGTKRRGVLALLARGAGRSVDADGLVDAIWPDAVPASGRAALQSHVSRLRRHLGPHAARLTRDDAGYRLMLADDELDASRFAAALRAARALAPDDPAAAAARLADARDAWRGPPLPDLVEFEPLAAWSRALTEEWLGAADLLAECALRAGDAPTAAAAAAAALALEPLREASACWSARALAAQERRAEALRVLHRFRRDLADATGLDPSPALAALEHEIADGAPASTTPSSTPSGPVRVRRRQPPEDLLGRDAELAGLVRLLADERLVTVVGPGGVGKSRLARAAADRIAPETGATVVELATVTDPPTAADALAAALDLPDGRGDPLERAVLALRDEAHLLVLDNCEHLLPAVRAVVDVLLERCPELVVLATSRERLAVGAEQTCLLAPLPMPASDDPDARAVPSVQLFVHRARRARPGFAPDTRALARIGRIVRALDGLPLAIELAAGRISSLSLDDLEARLDRALDLLGGGPASTGPASPRHRTLRATVAWSYDLLTPDEQRLFRNLAVFPGGFDLATAEHVARDLGVRIDPATALARLVDTSMVEARLDDHGPTRYRMLDTLRTFGIDELDATSERGPAQRRLLEWATALAVEIDAAYETPDEPRSDRRLRDELANLRTAWRTARDAGDVDVAAMIVVHVYTHAAWRDVVELFRWSLELAADPALAGHPREAQVLGVASEAAWSSAGDLARAEALARRAVARTRPGDELGRTLATWALADVQIFRGHYEEAAELAIGARRGTRWEAEGYSQAAMAATYAGDLAAARVHLAEAEARLNGPTLAAYTRYLAGEIANFAGEHDVATAAYRDAIERARAVGATFLDAIASVGLVTVQAARDEVDAALVGYRDLVDRWERTGAWTQQWTTLRNLADLLDRVGDASTADALRGAAHAAPEAAALRPGSGPGHEQRLTPGPSRTEALRLARDAIERALAGHASRPAQVSPTSPRG